VIVPVYNAEAYLPDCMESLMKQDCRDMEILLVDDGSTDGSGMLCDGYQEAYPGVRAIHQKNTGLGAARNTGIAMARGEYILFVDSKDRLHPDALGVLSRCVDETAADMYIFGFTCVREKKTVPGPVSPLAGLAPFRLEEHPELLLESPAAWMRLTRRSLWTENDFWFPERLWFGDLHTTGKLLSRCGRIVVIPDTLYCWRQRKDSGARRSDHARNLEVVDAVEALRSWFEEEELLRYYGMWLEVLAAENMMLAAQRVLMADPRAAYLPEFMEYLEEQFPDYQDNPLLDRLGKKKKMVLSLLRGRHYRILRGILRLCGC
jgi:glycosyltransferase involved in cell wall biosynthesis